MERTLQVLNELEQDGIMSRYAIGGAMGATFYVEPLLTFDLGIIVLLPQMNSGLLTLAPLYEALRAKGYTEEGECVLIEGVPVQFLPAYNALLEEALREARDMSYQATSAGCCERNTWLPFACKRAGQRIANGYGFCGNRRPWMTVPERHSPSASPGGEMEHVDRVSPEIEQLFRAKEQRQSKLAALPFHEKVRAVVQMQQLGAPVLLARGKLVRVWKLKTSDQ